MKRTSGKLLLMLSFLLTSSSLFAKESSSQTQSSNAFHELDWSDNRRAPEKIDPFEGFNRHLFQSTNVLAYFTFRPWTLMYHAVIPSPVRGVFGNFFSNLDEPFNIIYGYSALEGRKGSTSFARLLINSTIGIGGLLDVASPMGAKPQPTNVGNVLATYGVPPGPYIVFGMAPTNVRDILGSHFLSLGIDSFIRSRPPYTSLDSAGMFLFNLLEPGALLLQLDRLPKGTDKYRIVRSVYSSTQKKVSSDPINQNNSDLDELDDL